MKNPYYFLEKYIDDPNIDIGSTITLWNTNSFVKLSKQEIEKAEKYMGCPFPSQLRQFYEEIGYGNLTTPHNPSEDYHFYGANEIFPPIVAAHFYKGIIEHHTIEEKKDALDYNGDYFFSRETLEYTTPGDLPFFEIGDSSSFLMMKPQSSNPNAVYSEFGVLVEEEFSNFIWKLYYKSPSYYNDVLAEHYGIEG
ncbi:MAG: SMI1/KNR4 family protein [Proteobacteria bacterium]|nr:SMI1/KNR4 family protein [Pseudomonadota bacterium]